MTGITTGTPEPPAGKAAAWTTQAVLDAIHSGQLRAELLDDCQFWAAKAARQRMQAEAETDPSPPAELIEDWNIHNDHVDGLTADCDLDRKSMNRSRGSTADELAATATTGSGGTPVPPHVCGDCGEFLPHACAPVITILRERWTGRRIVNIQDRQPAEQRPELEREAG
jgi:hypothetical protein